MSAGPGAVGRERDAYRVRGPWPVWPCRPSSVSGSGLCEAGPAELSQAIIPFHFLALRWPITRVSVVAVLQAERPEGVKEAVRVLKVHLVPSGPGRALAALEVEDVLRYTRCYGSGEPALAGRDTREALDVGSAGGDHPTESVPKHLTGQGHEGRGGAARRPDSEARE